MQRLRVLLIIFLFWACIFRRFHRNPTKYRGKFLYSHSDYEVIVLSRLLYCMCCTDNNVADLDAIACVQLYLKCVIRDAHFGGPAKLRYQKTPLWQASNGEETTVAALQRRTMRAISLNNHVLKHLFYLDQQVVFIQRNISIFLRKDSLRNGERGDLKIEVMPLV